MPYNINNKTIFHHLNNVLNGRTPFLQILGYFFRFIFANLFLDAFNFIDNCFQMLNVKMILFLELYIVIKIEFAKKD